MKYFVREILRTNQFYIIQLIGPPGPKGETGTKSTYNFMRIMQPDAFPS